MTHLEQFLQNVDSGKPPVRCIPSNDFQASLARELWHLVGEVVAMQAENDALKADAHRRGYDATGINEATR